MLDFVQSIELGARIEGHITSLVRHRLNGRVIQITGALLRRHLQLRLRLRWGSDCAGAQQYQSKQNLQHFTHPNTHTHSGLYTGQLNWALIVLLLVAVKKNYRKKWAKVLRSFHSLSPSLSVSLARCRSYFFRSFRTVCNRFEVCFMCITCRCQRLLYGPVLSPVSAR